MNKQIILLITLFIISSVVLSGCDQKNDKPPIIDLTKVEIVNYTISDTLIDFLGEEYRQINGFVSNNAGKKIDKIEIEAEFYNSNDNYIISKYAYLLDVDNKDIVEFQIVYHSANLYYYNVDWSNTKLKINISENII